MRTCMAVARFHQLPYPLPGKRFAAHGKKELVHATVACEPRTPPLQIFLDSFDTQRAERNDPLFVAFATNENPSGIERQISHAQTRQFRNTQATRIEQLQ